MCKVHIIGKVAASHGVRGWLKVHSYTRPTNEILLHKRWLLRPAESEHWQSREVQSARQKGGTMLAKLTQVEDRDAAEKLRGQWIAVADEQLPALAEGEYYWRDLVGLAVVNQDGERLGVVDHLIETGANDVMVVRGGRTRLLPWISQVVREVDLAGGVVRVEWHWED